MGQISGVDAALITSIAGVAVANISYVGPTSAATLGLGGGGGGKVFTVNSWGDPLEACGGGQDSINNFGSQILYQTEDHFYTDSTLENPFMGTGGYYWCRTDNTSYAIDEMGGIKNSSVCPTVTGLVFTVNNWPGEEGAYNACSIGQEAINKEGSQTLYQNGEMLYVDAEYTTPFYGADSWWWCQTNNSSYKIAGEGNIIMINPC